MSDKKKSLIFRFSALGAAALAVLLDQISKILAVNALGTVGNVKEVIPGALEFKYVLNSGATAGILSEHRWIFMVASTVVIAGIAVWVALGKVKSGLNMIILGFIVGGGVGNMIDRVANGEVVDFIHVTLVSFFPFNTVFNVADMFVSLGCVVLIISVVAGEIKERVEKKKAEKEKETDSPAKE